MKRKKFINFFKINLFTKNKSIFLKKYFDRKAFFKNFLSVYHKKLNFARLSTFFFFLKRSVLPLFFSFWTFFDDVFP